jgi:hypothetical protein
MLRPLRTIAIRAALVISSVVVMLLALEVALRVFAPQLRAEIAYSDSAGLPRLKPLAKSVMSGAEFRVHLAIDAEGRRACPPLPADAGPSLLVLGDSMAFGWGVEVEDGVACQLQTILGRRVINAAVPGYGPIEEHLRLREALEAYQVDQIVVFAFGGNDLDDIDRSKSLFVAEWLQGQEKTYRYRAPIPFKDILSRRSHAYVFFSRHWTLLLLRFGLRENRLPFSRVYLSPWDPEYWSRAAVLVSLYSKMEQVASASRARLLIAYIPQALELDAALRERLLATYALPSQELDVEAPFRAFRAAAAAAGTGFLDLRPVFAGYPVNDVYYPLDGHWTPLGHRLAAGAVTEALAKAVTRPAVGR